MVVFLVILLLVALVFGVGAALEFALWTLLIVAAVVIGIGFLVRNALRRG
jgi:hypothetical protein